MNLFEKFLNLEEFPKNDLKFVTKEKEEKKELEKNRQQEKDTNDRK